MDDLSNIQKALLDVERTPERGINAAEGGQGKHDLTPTSKTEALPPLKRTKSKQRSGSTKKKRKEALIDMVGQVIREDCKSKVTALELETAFRECIESDCTKKDHFFGLETITNQSLVGAVRKIVKTATYDFRTKTYSGIALKIKDISSLFLSPVQGKYGVGPNKSSLASLIDKLQTKGNELSEFFDRPTGFNVFQFGRLFKEREGILDAVLSGYYQYLEELKAEANPEGLSKQQTKQLKSELKIISQLLDKGVRSGQNKLTPTNVINEELFSKLNVEIKAKCTFLHEMLETLVVDELAVERNTSKTADFKIKQVLHSLALLMNVRNQRRSNDIPFILGLAAVSYGAGEMFLTFLNNIGLTVSWQTL